MKKHNLYHGVLLLFVISLLFGCPDPVSNSHPNDTGTGGGGNGIENDTGENITNLTFTQYPYKVRTSNAVQGTVVGFIGNAEGGTPPYSYQLVSGNNDSDNNRFFIEGMNLKIKESKLPVSTYYVKLGVTDSKLKSFSIPVSITIYQDPVTKDQEMRYFNGILFVMRYVSKGSFSTIPFREAYYDLTVINIAQGFWMSETVVTQELFQSIMGYNPSKYNNSPAFGENQNKRLLENASYIEVLIFCNRLSQLDGKQPVYNVSGVENWLSFPNSNIESININSINELPTADGYRIPTEYEWQGAAIGADIGGFNSDGYRKTYSGGLVNSIDRLDDFVWNYYNSDLRTHEVRKKLPNEVGLYDMSGNVWEYIKPIAFPDLQRMIGYCFIDDFPQGTAIIYQLLVHYPLSENWPVGIRLVSNR